jgi:hypothetical protein
MVNQLERELRNIYLEASGWIRALQYDPKTVEGLLRYTESYIACEKEFVDKSKEFLLPHIEKNPAESDDALDMFNKYHEKFRDDFRPRKKA